MDWPGCTFYEELMERYPDAKVLLSVRDSDRWYESMRNTIYLLTRKPPLPLKVLYPLLGLVPRLRRWIRFANRLIFEQTFHENFENRRYAIEVFERHNKEVMERVPAEKLLVYEVKEGWEPLCEFLGVDVPHTPFPHINGTGTFRKLVLWLSVAEVSIGNLGICLVLMLFRGRLRALHR